MPKKCSKCGCIVADNANFCDECGAPLEDVSSFSNNSYGAVEELPKLNMYSPGNNVPNLVHPVTVQEHGVSGTAEAAIVTSGSKVLGIVSLIFGILSIVTIGSWFFPEIIAIVCGALSKDSNGQKTKLGKAGFVCGIIGAVLVALIIIIAIISI